MFGAIWALISGAAIAKEGIKNWNKDFNSKYDAIGNSPFGTYFDHKGRRRLIENDQLVDICKNSDGDACIVAIPSGNVLRNLSEEERQAKKEKFKESYDEYHTVIRLDENKKRKDLSSKWWYEDVYEDILTGKRYVVRKFDKKYNKFRKEYEPDYYVKKLLGAEIAEKMSMLKFYMNIETGKLVRFSDSYKRLCKEIEDKANNNPDDESYGLTWKKVSYSNNQADEFILKFNEFQDNRKDEKDDHSSYYIVSHKYIGNEEDSKR